jgi:hypothetical protein
MNRRQTLPRVERREKADEEGEEGGPEEEGQEAVGAVSSATKRG